MVLSGVRIRCTGGDARAGVNDLTNSAFAVEVRRGTCRLEACAVTCPSGSGVLVLAGHLACTAGSHVGPCGRHGVSCTGGAAALDGAVVEGCSNDCVLVKDGSRADISGSTLNAAFDSSICCMYLFAPATGLTTSGSKLTGDSAAPRGTGVFVQGAGLEASVVGCRLVGFETAAWACGKAAKLSLRDCMVVGGSARRTSAQWYRWTAAWRG